LPHIENPPRRHLPGAGIRAAACGNAGFQWAPTLGGECYEKCSAHLLMEELVFQWAPTLGGECYEKCSAHLLMEELVFQWAPTLGGECYRPRTGHE